MKKQTRTRLQKAMALVLSAIIVLSAFAVMPANLFLKAGAAEDSTIEGRYDAVKNQIEGLTLNAGSAATVDYYSYPATPNGTDVANEETIIPDGEYVVTGADGSVMTHGLQAIGTATEASDIWVFEQQSSGKYHIYYNDGNATKQYLNINGSNLTVATTAQEIVVRATLGGVLTVGDGNGNYINFSDNAVVANADATNLNLYKVIRTEANPNPTLLSDINDIESGKEYIIVNTTNDGVMNPDPNNLTFSGAVSSDSPTWTFVASGDGYKLKFNDNGTDRYLYLSDPAGAAVLATESEAKAFTLAFEAQGVTFSHYVAFTSDCDAAVDTKFYIQKDQNTIAVSGTRDSNRRYHRIYMPPTEASVKITPFIPTPSSYDEVPPIEEGGYVVYHNGVIMGRDAVTADATGVNEKEVTVSNSTINALVMDQYYFEHVEGSLYNISVAKAESNGSIIYQYLHFNGEEGYLTFSSAEEAVIVYANPDGTVQIFDRDSSQKINHYSTNLFSSYGRNNAANPDGNESLTLYRNPSASKGMVDKTELYNALNEAIEYAPDNYTEASYNKFLQTLEDSLDIYYDGSVVDEKIVTKTVYNIRNAIVNLEKQKDEPDYRSFPATLYKYGYNPSATTANAKYSAGGALFNAQTYASMEDIIRADENLMTQIKATIGYHTNAWAAGEADIALDKAITAYAEIYSLAFTGNTLSSGGTNVTDFQNTAWNVWTKSNTGSDSGGASVQGLFSALLNDGNPADHAPYSQLAYGNVSNYLSGYYNTNTFSLSITVGGSARNVTLAPLQGISVHVNDIFTREKVLVDGSTTEYSKYYWDFDFPFQKTTVNGVNTYKYSSKDTSYLFQAEFNDAEQTATAQLTPGSGSTGFFPFNNQLNSNSNPSASVYHFGMSFSTDFYIPVTGYYLGNEGTDIVFNFSGDDDVLVYIDDVLVLDNGGLHAARTASINFTDESVSYQYAMNVGPANATVESSTENAVTYKYGNTSGLTGDELAALEKLHEVRTDGGYHTFTFYYLERGSNESNCEIEFNIQQASNHVLLNDETLVVDYGLPVEYDIKANDKVDEIEGLGYNYKGIVEGNNEVPSVVIFNEPTDLVRTFASKDDVLDVQGLKYGTATMSGDGLVTYNPNTMNMTGRDYFYSCAEITGDPTYTTNYYQYERAIFIPATTIYYEDNFGVDIIFKDGSGNAKWTTDGDVNAFADAKQAADLVDDVMANPYGYDPIYSGADTTKDYTMYSGFSAQKVTVGKNLATNPTVEFTFTGTGFDIISMTDSTTGAFYVDIFDTNNKQVGKKMVVDTYYGCSYGQLYADENGEATLTETDTPLYRSAVNEAIAKEPTYFAVDGMGYTETPTYYDANGNLTETETENPAYAYAYGWVTTDNAEGLYQIPVIKKTDLAYGTYKVVITPMYSRLFDNTGKGQFDVYIDAIRIYNPAGKDDNIESSILTDYKYDNESYPNYLTIKDIIIGADSLSKDSATQGVVFIDGIAALDNDLEKLKLAGPNNELYLAKGQAVAFEIWATAIPDEVQLGVKSVKGKPTLGITYNGNTVEKDINTATEMNYIINNLLPANGKLEWSKVVVNGEPYYRTDTIVIQNLSDDSSILSLTNMKWTFTGVGQHGHYETQDAEPVMMFMARRTTVSDAYAMMSNDNVPNDGETDNNAGSEIILGDNNNTNDTNDTNDENQGVLTFIQRIIEAITNFFKKIFGLV